MSILESAGGSGHRSPIGRGRLGRRRGHGEALMVPAAEFRSYYDRPIVKASPWESDVPAYLFLGGLAGGSSLLAAGADLTGRPGLRRSGRLTAVAAVAASFAALVHDLGRPARFHHMLRVAKISSPMSVGTWILTGYGPMAAVAAATEMTRLLPPFLRRIVGGPGSPLGRSAGVVAAGLAPALASYTAVLLSDTATPTWHESHRHLPFVFVGSAAAAAGGMGLLAAPLAESGPACVLAVGGAVVDLLVAHRMEASMGITAEPLHIGRAGRYMQTAKALTAGGAVLATVAGRRSRLGAALAGISLLVGSVCTRFGIFYAGQQSADDPRYVVVPQRARLKARNPTPRATSSD